MDTRHSCRFDTTLGVWHLSLAPRTAHLRVEVLDHRRPHRLLWRSNVPLRAHGDGRQGAQVTWCQGEASVSVLRQRGRIVDVSFSMHLLPTQPPTQTSPPAATRPEPNSESRLPRLQRAAANPILQPQHDQPWRALAAFNPAAVHIDDEVHLFYRAVGHDGFSVIGHAVSRDGMRIDELSAAPVFSDTRSLAGYATADVASTSPHRSGPSLFGCEDPRVTQIDGRLYMTYTAFDGCHPPAVALTSIAVDDLRARRWIWRDPVLLSPAHEAHKNWVLFPERIGGRYAILHGISPSIQIAYCDRLDFDGRTRIPSHYACSGNENGWDNRVRGAGPPPIRTEDGWLVLYHAMDRRDPGRYKLGALLLDADDPSRIVGRLPYPLLEPDADYENEGCKRGVVYACGATLVDDRLTVYYGGADTVACAATMPLRRLMTQLQTSLA